MLNFSQLKCFTKVSDHLNFNKAADELCITTTAVSKQIKKLENQFGEALFIRHTRNVQLTDFGAILLEKCKQLLKEASEIEQYIETRQIKPQGQLKILVSTILSKKFILDRLPEFIKEYPSIQCEFLFSEQDKELSRNDIDVMVGFPQIPPFTDKLKYRRMNPVQNILCAAPSLVECYGNPKHVKDLMRFPFISHSLRKPATCLPLANNKHIPCPSPILFMDEFNALNQACKDGIGIFLTGDILVKKELSEGTLIQLLPQIEFKHYEIYTFYQSYGYEVPKIRAFLDFYIPQNHKV
jgi:DNA-binding transcriptional LysR family regulator